MSLKNQIKRTTLFKSSIIPIIFFGLLFSLSAEDKPNHAILIAGKKSTLNDGIIKTMQSFGCQVTLYDRQMLKKKDEIKKLTDSLLTSSLIILDKKSQECSSYLLKDEDFKKNFKHFFQNGGTMLSLWRWLYVGSWQEYFKENNIWYPDYKPFKVFLKYRHIFPSGNFIRNPKVSFPLLDTPNKLTGILGYQNFGYVFPNDKTHFSLVVRENNSRCTGVTLQTEVFKKGNVIYSLLFEFISLGKKTSKYKDEPLAHHSILFLQNLVKFIKTD